MRKHGHALSDDEEEDADDVDDETDDGGETEMEPLQADMSLDELK